MRNDEKKIKLNSRIRHDSMKTQRNFYKSFIVEEENVKFGTGQCLGWIPVFLIMPLVYLVFSNFSMTLET